MSGLEALGVACNIMTVIGFGLAIVSICRRINATGQSDPELAQQVANLSAASIQVQKLNGVTSPDQQATDAGRRLQESMRKLQASRPGGDGTLEKALSVVKTIRRKRRLESLKSRLEQQRSVMNTSLIVLLPEQAGTSGQLNADSFVKIDRGQRNFVAMYARGSKALEDLVKAESQLTRDHNAAEHAKLHDAMLRREESRQDREACKALLDSLNYDGMNDRQSTIKPRHNQTFDWIFKDIDADRSRSDMSQAGQSSQSSGNSDISEDIQVLHNDQHLVAQFIGDNRGLTYKNSGTDWSLEELKVLLFKGIRNADQGYLVLLDALDEVDRRDEGLDQFLGFIHEL
ncbi:hypothetical protein CSAL01_11237 [Colletotrichum salicis]|uniref:Uncharacterized protein n=1 Tax=Colletotrichum salicis TaxID=1209931 RepID=A0A135UX01_9PEZI|nr:hypothetical protein CSAL01_11237 [Colletotrichum salicis]